MQTVGTGHRRRWRRIALVVLTALLLLLTLGWFFPARWALAWRLPPMHGLQLQQVHGSLWNGRAERVLLADGSVLGHVRWQVSRRALFTAVPVQVDFAGPQLVFSGSVQAAADGRVRWDNVQLRADLALWRPHGTPTPGQPRGMLRVTVAHALLQDGWPLQLDLRARWRDAALLVRKVNIPLGALDIRATAHAGVVDARVNDVDAGPLQVLGTLQLSPLGWWLDARLRARHADPALQHWLATLGGVDTAGSVHVQRRGGLALAAPMAPAPAGSAVLSTRTPRGQP
jgi:general secretion pathway protein N